MVPRNAYSLILLALIIFKVSSAAIHFHLHHRHEHQHPYQHFGLHHHQSCEQEHGEGHDDENDCKLCDNALFISNVEFSVITVFHHVKDDISIELHQPKNDYKSALIASFLDNGHFVRPPPPSNC